MQRPNRVLEAVTAKAVTAKVLERRGLQKDPDWPHLVAPMRFPPGSRKCETDDEKDPLMKRKEFMTLVEDAGDAGAAAIDRCRATGADPEEEIELSEAERWFHERLRKLEAHRIQESKRLDEAFRQTRL